MTEARTGHSGSAELAYVDAVKQQPEALGHYLLVLDQQYHLLDIDLLLVLK